MVIAEYDRGLRIAPNASLWRRFKQTATDWRDSIRIEMCSSKTSMQLAPFRIAGMDIKVEGMGNEMWRMPDGIPGEQVSCSEYDANFEVYNFLVRLHRAVLQY